MMRPDISEGWRRKCTGLFHIRLSLFQIMVTVLLDRDVPDCVQALCKDLECDFMTYFCTRDGADVFYPDFFPDLEIGRLQ
jgi:hypothetical protein